MRDRAAVRILALGPVDIDVDPLVIASAGRERVDARLVDGDPIRHAQLVADLFAHLSNCEIAHARLLPRRRTTVSSLDYRPSCVEAI